MFGNLGLVVVVVDSTAEVTIADEADSKANAAHGVAVYISERYLFISRNACKCAVTAQLVHAEVFCDKGFLRLLPQAV